MQNKLHVFNILIKNQIVIFKNKKLNIILFSLYFLIATIFNLVSILLLNLKTDVVSNFTYINLFIILNSVFLLIILSFMVSGTLFGQLSNNIHKLELRQGIGTKSIFFSRLTFILLTTFIFLSINMVTSLVFAGIGWATIGDDILVYRAFISCWAWYYMFSFIVITLSVFIISIGKNATLINTLIILFNFLILLCVSLFSVIGLVSSNTNSSSFNDIRFTNNFLMKVDNSLKLKKEINSNPILKSISEEALSNTTVDTDNFIAGYKTWSNFESELLGDISKHIETLFTDSNLNEWSDVLEFSKSRTIHYENINSVAKYAKKNNTISDYEGVFDFVLNNSSNQSYYKSINLGHIIDDSIQNYNLLNDIKKMYTPDEFLFTKTLMEKIYFSDLNNIFSNQFASQEVGLSQFINNIKNNRIKNIINPFRHFVLMFQSVDYSNDVLINQIGSDQILFGYLNNIKVESLDGKEITFENLQVKRDIPVEVIYIIYSFISSLILYFSSFIFIKKIK